jgi:hypothetical protein
MAFREEKNSKREREREREREGHLALFDELDMIKAHLSLLSIFFCDNFLF